MRSEILLAVGLGLLAPVAPVRGGTGLEAAVEEISRLHQLYDREVRSFREVRARAGKVKHIVKGQLWPEKLDAGKVPLYLGKPSPARLLGYLPAAQLEELNDLFRAAHGEGATTWSDGEDPPAALRGLDDDTARWSREYFQELWPEALRLHVPPPMEKILIEFRGRTELTGGLGERYLQLPLLRGKASAAIALARRYRPVVKDEKAGLMGMALGGSTPVWKNRAEWKQRKTQVSVRLREYLRVLLEVRRMVLLGCRGVMARSLEGHPEGTPVLEMLPAALLGQVGYRQARAWFRGAFDALQASDADTRWRQAELRAERREAAENAPGLRNPFLSLPFGMP